MADYEYLKKTLIPLIVALGIKPEEAFLPPARSAGRCRRSTRRRGRGPTSCGLMTPPPHYGATSPRCAQGGKSDLKQKLC